MADLMLKKNKHMTISERSEIQDCLNHNMNFKAIAKQIKKDQTSVSKEVKKHITVFGSPVKLRTTDGTDAMNPVCPKLLKAPFVCNGCEKRHKQCSYAKHLYEANKAQKSYKATLSESRQGIPLGKQEFYEIDRVISEKFKQGQHIYHILASNNLGVSKSTVYRHINLGYLSVSRIDLPRAVKFKPRKRHHDEYVPKALKEGRTYDDFLAFTEDNGIHSWVEMDTVIGRIGGKTLLTLDFTFCNFMIGILLENKSSFEVSEKLRGIKEKLVANGIGFGKVFPLILTDNGGEFSDVFTIENSLDGEKETNLFFCDPYKSCQKPNVEKNHTLFRDIAPKGESFDNLNQKNVNMIFSHVNGVKRDILNGRSPYEVFAFTYGVDIASILGISFIPAIDVIQSPKLLKH